MGKTVVIDNLEKIGEKPAKGLSLKDRKLFIPRMTYIGARCLAAALSSIGIEAEVMPESDLESLEIGSRYTNGDECLPQRVTLGDMIKLVSRPGFDPSRSAIFWATSTGPCRFGQYLCLMRNVLDQLGYEDLMIVSLSSSDGYQGAGEIARELMVVGWYGVMASDIVRKLLLRFRPYELEKGMTDEVYEKAIDRICEALAKKGLGIRERHSEVKRALLDCKRMFAEIPKDLSQDRLLIGVVGEIFCRLHRFSNQDLIRKIEEHGGEAWLAGVAEWILYTNVEQQNRLRQRGKRFSLEMAKAKIKDFIQKWQERSLYSLFEEEFRGREDPEDVRILLEYTRPYLPPEGSLGEMVLSVGGSIYLAKKGVDGIADISPFTCMNGIVSESVYPAVMRDLGGIPIKMFYFDGKAMDLDRDVAIFMELAKTYRRKRKGVARNEL